MNDYILYQFLEFIIKVVRLLLMIMTLYLEMSTLIKEC